MEVGLGWVELGDTTTVVGLGWVELGDTTTVVGLGWADVSVGGGKLNMKHNKLMWSIKRKKSN